MKYVRFYLIILRLFLRSCCYSLYSRMSCNIFSK